MVNIMMTKSALIVEDDEMVADFLSDYLIYAGFTVIAARDGKEAIELLEKNKNNINIIISDITMPVMDGFNLFRFIRGRKEFCKIPLLMISGKSDKDTKYLGFEAGCDDYLIKPFDLTDLLIKVKSLIRRTELITNSNSIEKTVVLQNNTFKINDKNISFTPTEIGIFSYLYTNKNTIITSEEILSKVLNYPKGTGSSEIIRTHIKNIRNKIENTKENPQIIMHIAKKGYYLNSEKISSLVN